VSELVAYLDSHRAQLSAALPSDIDLGDFVRLALVEVSKNPQLRGCDPQSLFLALVTAARYGVVPGPQALGYLIPRRTRDGRVSCEFMPGWRLFVQLARESGEVLRVECHTVHQGDDFQIELGTQPSVVHRPALGERGPMIGVYTVARMTDGGDLIEWMTAQDVAACKKAAGRSPAWAEWPTEMARKACIKRAAKHWPLGPQRSAQVLGLASHDHTVTAAPAPSMGLDASTVDRFQTYGGQHETDPDPRKDDSATGGPGGGETGDHDGEVHGSGEQPQA
jgi:recombination protein RecT